MSAISLLKNVLEAGVVYFDGHKCFKAVVSVVDILILISRGCAQHLATHGPWFMSDTDLRLGYVHNRFTMPHDNKVLSFSVCY
jgi:hypothetical protein